MIDINLKILENTFAEILSGTVIEITKPDVLFLAEKYYKMDSSNFRLKFFACR